MTEVAHLKVAPTFKQQVDEQIVRIFEKLLAEAKAGVISDVFIVCGRTDGDWTDDISGTDNFCRGVGRIEVAKQKMIEAYHRQERER